MITGCLLVITAWILASSARSYSEQQILREWEMRHSPSPILWRKAMEAQGYHVVSDPKQIHRTLSHLPNSLDEAGNVWISEDHAWICLFLKPDEEIPVLVFHFGKASPSHLSWKKLGRGWNGFETALDLISRLHEQDKKTVTPIDPREIQY